MNRKKIRQLLKIVNGEIIKANKRLSVSETQSSEIALVASPSQSGDRTHAEGQVQIMREFLLRLNNLKTELIDAEKRSVEDVTTPCFVELKSEKKQSKNYYIVENVVDIEGVDLVSKKASFGQYIIGKKINEKIRINKIYWEITNIE